MSRATTTASRRSGSRGAEPRPSARRRGTRGQRVAASIVAIGLVGVAILVATGAFGHQPTAPRAPGFPAPTPVPTAHDTIKPVGAGRVTVWPLPEKLVSPRDVLVTADGTVWTTEQDRGRVDALKDGRLTRYATDTFPYVGAFGLSAGPGGSVWFSGYPGGSVARVLPNGSANGFAPFTDGSATVGVAQGPGGTMWVTDARRPVLVAIGADGTVAQYEIRGTEGASASDMQPRDITAGMDGTMWFTDPGTEAVGSVSTATPPVIVEHPLGGGATPRSIAAAPDGPLWVTLTNRRALAEIDPTTGAAKVVPLEGANGTLNDLLVAPDGTIWVSEDGPYLLHVTTDGSTIERVKLPAGITYTDGLSRAPDGTIWAAATDASALVSVKPGA